MMALPSSFVHLSATDNDNSMAMSSVARVLSEDDIDTTPSDSALDRQTTDSTRDTTVTPISDGDNPSTAPYNGKTLKASQEEKRLESRRSNLSNHAHLSEGSSCDRKVDSMLLSPRRHDSPSVSSSSPTPSENRKYRRRKRRSSTNNSKKTSPNCRDGEDDDLAFDQIKLAESKNSTTAIIGLLDVSHGTITTCPSSTNFTSPVTPRVALPSISSASGSSNNKNISSSDEANIQTGLAKVLAKWEDSIELAGFNDPNDDNGSISSLEISLAGLDDEFSPKKRNFRNKATFNDSTVTILDIDFLEDQDDGNWTEDDVDIALERFQPHTSVTKCSVTTNLASCGRSATRSSRCSSGEVATSFLRQSLTRRDSAPALPTSSHEVRESRWLADSTHGTASSIGCSTRSSVSGGGSVDIQPPQSPKRVTSESVLASNSKAGLALLPGPTTSSSGNDKKDIPPPSPRRFSSGAGLGIFDSCGVEKFKQSRSGTKKVPNMLPRWSNTNKSLLPYELLDKAIRTAKQWDDDVDVNDRKYNQIQPRRNLTKRERRWSCI